LYGIALKLLAAERRHAGYKSMLEGVERVLLFLLACGPSLLIWAALLFFPARIAWRRFRRG